ncbi:MAG: tetratricopeptide repeat protein [Woeseiaceae bacterium]|nr:tetratricopeptide repeat protein [Woeseiaceae bacterium]
MPGLCRRSAWCTERLGLYDEAEGFLEESAELSRRVLPRTNETQVRGLEQLAWIAYRREDWARSSEFAREALELRESLVGPDDPALADPLNLLGTAAFWMDDMDASLHYYNRALALLDAAGNEEQLLEKARTLNHLGIVYAYIGQNDEAEAAYLASLDLRLRLFDARHPRIGAAKANLAAFYHGTADFDAARKFAGEALEIDRAVLGDEHVDVAHDLALLAGISNEIGITKPPSAMPANRRKRGGPPSAGSIRAMAARSTSWQLRRCNWAGWTRRWQRRRRATPY